MKCDEATEYVSALCDDATVPAAAAEHIDDCELCRARLREYVEMAAELRRAASLEIAEVPALRFRPGRRSLPAFLWQKAGKRMGIPRLAFASLIAATVVLASGWARQAVRAASRGSVLLVQFSTDSGPGSFCALSAVDKKLDSCSGVDKAKAGWFLWGLEVLSKNGDNATLGVRAAVGPENSTSHVNDLPQQHYVLSPGQTLQVNVPGLGIMSITGQWIDHMPVMSIGSVGDNRELDPAQDEVRFFSPLLLHGDHVLGDLEGMSAYNTADQTPQAVDLYMKGAGRFDFSLSPMPGAVQGKVQFNRVTVAINGESYTFVTGAPITRSDTLWVRFNPNPPAWDSNGGSYIGAGKISELLGLAAQSGEPRNADPANVVAR